MCGISGIVNKVNKSISNEEIKLMNDLVFHRGPDGEGYYFGDNFAFGHRRLSIIDLSENAAQPMKYDEDYAITFNGAIYNYIELKAELQSFGLEFKSNSDTEVILASYVQWGEDCVNHFNGMWSFSIFDKKKNVLFCSRDRFGIKPFYYYSDNDRFVFGSEIKQLLPYLTERKVNEQILIDFIVTGVLEHTNETFFQNIYKLPAFHNLIYNLNSHEFKIEKYYNIDLHKNIDIDSYEKINSELKRSVNLRLRSDVKIGSCLSGGIDSSTIVALATQNYNSEAKFLSIHAKTTEARNNESRYAQEVSKKLNSELKILEPKEMDFIENLEKLVKIQEEPFGSPGIFMQYFIFEEAKKNGLKVMLDGQGGDEIFLGYEKYFPAYFRDVYNRKGLSAMVREIFLANRNNEKMGFKDIVRFILGTKYPKIRKMAFRKRTFFLKRYDIKFNFINEFSSSFDDIQTLQKLEILKTMLPELLRYEDKNSMYNSIESRLPFLDYHLVEAAICLSSEYKINAGWTKYILRSILSDLIGGDIAWRKKKNNFNAPSETWLQSIKPLITQEVSKSKIIEKLADKELLIKKIDKLNLTVKWRLLNIALWERIYKVEI